MVRQDIVGGLRNALERGQSLQKAVQSFINAGYPPEDVEEAANYVGEVPGKKQIKEKRPEELKERAAEEEIGEELQPTSQLQPERPQKQYLPTTRIEPETGMPEKPHKRFDLRIIILILFLLILFGILAGLIFAREQIITYFQVLFA